MTAEVFRIESRRLARGKRVQSAQHVVAAILLIVAASSHLGGHSEHIVLPLLEILTAVALIVAAIVQKVRKTHTRIAWFELAGSAMTFVEAVGKLRQPHHTLFYVLSFIPPVILFVFALFEERIHAGLRLEANDEAFIAQTHIFRRRRVPWQGLTTYAIAPKRLVLTRDDGQARSIPIADFANREEAMEWAEAQFAKRGLRRA